MANGDMITGFVLGVAATLAARAALRATEGDNPIARALGRSAATLGEKFQETAAELGEVLEDTVAELQAQSAAQAEARVGEAAAGSVEPEPPTGPAGGGDPARS